MNKGNTLHLIKSEHNKVFGGYKSIVHTVSGNYSADANAFLFSLTNHQRLNQNKSP